MVPRSVSRHTSPEGKGCHRRVWAVLMLTCWGAAAALAEPAGSDAPLFPRRLPPTTHAKLLSVKGVSKTLAGVPEYGWWYGCSPTAAGMVIGWWDAQPGCEGLFEGSAATWSGSGTEGTKRMVASQAHIDTGSLLGLTYGSFARHTAECLADFLRTVDGSTSRSDIGPGLTSYCAWADPGGYKRVAYQATTTTHRVSSGWTYAAYCAEIDAGRPVHLGLTSDHGGHSVVGLGYDNSGGQQKYLCYTTWAGWGIRSWGWTGETESGYGLRVSAGTYLQVVPKATSQAPSAPAAVTVTPGAPRTTTDLVAKTSEATSSRGVTYQYEWACSVDGGSTWGAWTSGAARLPAASTVHGQCWRARARAITGSLASAWVDSAPVVILDTPPTRPTVTLSPGTVTDGQAVAAAAAGSRDPDGDAIGYLYRWYRSTDGGATWSGSLWTRPVLLARLTRPGDLWAVQARARNTCVSPWSARAQVRVSAVPAPTAVTLCSSAAASRAGNATISVRLSSPAAVAVVVRNTAGIVVAALPARQLPAGLSSLVWNGRAASGLPTPAGRYLLELQARTPAGAAARAIATLQR